MVQKTHSSTYAEAGKISTGRTGRTKKKVNGNNNSEHTPSIDVQNHGGNDDNPSQSIDISQVEYGDIEPTGYVSHLSHEDWGVQYCEYKWRLQYLRDMDKKIWNSQKILVKVGRDHGKTWEMIKLFCRWFLEKRTKIICVATPAKLDEIYQAVLTILQSDKIRQDYGDVIVRSGIQVGIWALDVEDFRKNPSDTRMVGPNFSVQPAEGSITGLHADEGWLHLEDPVQDVKVADEAERRRWRWFKRTVRYIASRGENRTKITANGTSKDIGDFYDLMEKETHYPVYTIPTLEVMSGRLPTKKEVEPYVDHIRELVTGWPDVGTYKFSGCPNWTREAVMYEFIFHPDDAHAELNNDPLPMEGFEFKKSDWIEVDPRDYDYYDGLNKFTVVDPGFGRGGSKTAILVFAIYFNQLHLIDATVKHLGATAFIDQILNYHEQYHIDETHIEDNFVQVSRGLSAYNPLTNLEGLRLYSSPSGQTKRARISLLGGVFGSHIVRIVKSLPFKDIIKQEYLTFSSELSDAEIRKKFNALDTLAMAYKRLKRYLGKKRSGNKSKYDTKRTRSKTSRSRNPFG